MQVIVKYFGIFQDCLTKTAAQQSSQRAKTVEFSPPCTVAELYRRVSQTFPEKKKFPKVLFAVNQEFVKSSHRLCDGDEVGFIPPMSGG